MNDEFYLDANDPELEVRLTALVLGEASDFERAQLMTLLDERPELAAWYEQLTQLHAALSEMNTDGLVEELPAYNTSLHLKSTQATPAEASPERDSWKLTADRRQLLLAVIEGELPNPSSQSMVQRALGSIVALKHKRGRRWVWGLALSVCLLLACCSVFLLQVRHNNSVLQTASFDAAHFEEKVRGYAAQGFEREYSTSPSMPSTNASDMPSTFQFDRFQAAQTRSVVPLASSENLDGRARYLDEQLSKLQSSQAAEEINRAEAGSVALAGRSLSASENAPSSAFTAPGAMPGEPSVASVDEKQTAGNDLEAIHGFRFSNGMESGPGGGGMAMDDSGSMGMGGMAGGGMGGGGMGGGFGGGGGGEMGGMGSDGAVAPSEFYGKESSGPRGGIAVPSLGKPASPELPQVALEEARYDEGSLGEADGEGKPAASASGQNWMLSTDDDFKRAAGDASKAESSPTTAGVPPAPAMADLDLYSLSYAEQAFEPQSQASNQLSSQLFDYQVEAAPGQPAANEWADPNLTSGAEVDKSAGKKLQDRNSSFGGYTLPTDEINADGISTAASQPTKQDSDFSLGLPMLAENGRDSTWDRKASEFESKAVEEEALREKQLDELALTQPEISLLLKNGVLGPADGSSTKENASTDESLETLGRISRGRVTLSQQMVEKSKGVTQVQSLDETLAAREPFSTFSLHVSDVSFKLAQAALSNGQWPDASKIRLEEFVNAFDYYDPLPSSDERVACQLEQAVHPSMLQRNMLRISLRTSSTGRPQSVPLRLTLLLDNSGSMERADRRQTIRRAFEALAKQLTPNDQVTLISFANTPRLLAERVSGANLAEMVQLVEGLPSEGGTNLEAALRLAMEKAGEGMSSTDATTAALQNRIVLLTDGAVNLGDADPDSLSKMVLQMRESGIAFDAAGISAQDLNDEVLEALTREGDGRYYLLDSVEAATAGFADQIAGALRPAAKNVKVQVEFNPDRVVSYKLLGFEKHLLKQEDFRNDKVDAAEMAAAEAGVALYQFEPKPDGYGDIGSISVRFQDLATGTMVERRWPIPYESNPARIEQANPKLRVATAAALFAAKLRGDAVGDGIEFKSLSELLTNLPSQWQSAMRVRQLINMTESARQLSER